MSINPNIRKNWKNNTEIKSVDYYFNGIINQNRFVLSEAISLVERSVEQYIITANQLLDRCFKYNKEHHSHTWRIGITGSPGVGKSSFIETWGTHLVEERNKRVAVLAIDPSSTLTQGSILGDKTRMPKLSNNENAFIRPSPSRNCLGGVSSATKETICLCEAAGYDVIIVETVGVGQSETMISQLVDMFVLILLPGAGDEIQGIKRGIVEMADLVLVNKSDGDNIGLAKIIQQNYKNALHLFQAKAHGQVVDVLRCSSIESTGIEEIWNHVNSFFDADQVIQYRNNYRLQQELHWFESRALFTIEHRIMRQEKYQTKLKHIKQQVLSNQISPYEAGSMFENLMIEVFK